MLTGMTAMDNIIEGISSKEIICKSIPSRKTMKNKSNPYYFGISNHLLYFAAVSSDQFTDILMPKDQYTSY